MECKSEELRKKALEAVIKRERELWELSLKRKLWELYEWKASSGSCVWKCQGSKFGVRLCAATNFGMSAKQTFDERQITKWGAGGAATATESHENG